MDKPIRFNFPDNFRNNGKRPFVIGLKYKSGTVLDLTGVPVSLNVFNAVDAVLISLSTVNGGISILPDKKIQINEIKRLKLPVGCYRYELTASHPSITRTYLHGNWRVTK